MTEAFLALRDLAALIESLSRKPPVPAMAACTRQAETLFEADAPPERPPDDVIEALRQELHDACASSGLGGLSPRTLRRAPLVFWDRAPYSASLPGLVDAFFERAARRDRMLREVIEAWLRDFGPDLPRFAKSGEAISALVSRSELPSLAFWAKADRRYALFDATRGVRTIGAALLNSQTSLEDLLTEIGMNDPLRATGRFFRAAVAEMLRTLPAALDKPNAAEAFDRARTIIETRQATQDQKGRLIERNTLRFPDLAGDVIAAVLSPWLTDHRAPASAPKDAIKAFLLSVVGDPRLFPARWAVAPEPCTRVMRRWLAEASLEMFFDLISSTNNDPQWRRRRAFWRACLRRMPQDQPAEVWVVLGSGMALRARAVKELANGYGRMDGSGSYGEQAVLLIRLGEIVLCEWSNVGPIRAWRRSDRECPQLYRVEYSWQALRAHCLAFRGADKGTGLRHDRGEEGYWQALAAEFLRQSVNLHLHRDDYMTE